MTEMLFKTDSALKSELKAKKLEEKRNYVNQK